MITAESIAQICHEANRAYCATIGDNSQPEWEDAPLWQKNSAVTGVAFLVRAIENGMLPGPSALHDNWLKDKVRDGWKFGTVKDIEKKTHPCLVPFDQLPEEQKTKDRIFRGIVFAFFSEGIR